MTDVLVAEYFISFDHAMKMIKKLKVKKHAALGYWYELEDLGRDIWQCLPLVVPRANKPIGVRLTDEEYAIFSKRVYADYRGGTPAFHLKVYRPA